MENFGELECLVRIEKVGSGGKPIVYDRAHVQLGRNQASSLVLKINTQSFFLKDFKILQKFATEGKATLMFTKIGKNLMFSNAPPDKLIAFLKILRIKSKIVPSSESRKKEKSILGTKNCFNEISPLTVQDIKTYKNVACIASPPVPSLSSKDTTPVLIRKRKMNGEPSQKTRKRLNSAQPIFALGKTPPHKASAAIKDIVNGGHNENKELNLFGKLTDEQLTVFDFVKKGLNVFFTGGAGTGKSYLLKKIIGFLPPGSTVASASTGVAACLIGGITLHSFAGIGSGEASIERCIELASRSVVAQNWKQCKVLIIDEISMIDSVLFDKLEQVARVVRRNEKPFGGIQLVLCGDFLQLPPVQKGNNKKFCFQAKSWSSCIQVSYELTQVKRQTDQEFIALLRYIRLGKCPDHVYDRLMQTQKNPIEQQGIQATQLCTHKENAVQINQLRIKQLKGDEKVFRANDSSPEYTEQLNKALPVEKRLVLKVGAQVMLTKNLDVHSGLVNGARGVITKFASSNDGLPEVKFSTGALQTVKPEKFVFKTANGHVTRTQLPLRLAWAISIHKSQGLTLNCCEVSLSRVFEHGQAYVALSRAKTLEGLRVLDINRSAIKADRDVLRFYIQMRRELRMRGFLEPNT